VRHEHLIGGFASMVLATSVLIVLSPVERNCLQRRDLRTAIPLACLGLFLGFAHRVTTAAMNGANIGGGLALVPSMLLLALVQYR
jgi:hypothetical protein